jgi:hypothetical protein
MNPVSFVQQILAAGARSYFDAFSFHPDNDPIPFSGSCPTCPPTGVDCGASVDSHAADQPDGPGTPVDQIAAFVHASQHLYQQFVDAVAAAMSNWPASFSAPAATTDAVPLVVKAASVETREPRPCRRSRPRSPTVPPSAGRTAISANDVL